MARPTQEVFPGGSVSEPWPAAGEAAELELDYEAGGAWVAADGAGALGLSLDGHPQEAIEIGAPGAYELFEHGRHERHRLSLRPSTGVSVYSVGFSAGVPAA